MSIGIDLVHIPSFAEQLGQPGTDFLAKAFHARERMEAVNRRLMSSNVPLSALDDSAAVATDSAARFFAGRWAAKEAFIKAWSQSLFGQPPVVSPDLVDWREISCVADAWGRVSIQLSGTIAQLFAQTVSAAASVDIPAAPRSARSEGYAATAMDKNFSSQRDGQIAITAVSISHDGEYATAVVQL